MKNRSNPVVVAWVTTKSPTPSVIQARLITIALRRAVRKRRAMRRVVDTGRSIFGAEESTRSLDLHPTARGHQIQAVHQDLFTFLQPLEAFHVIQAYKTDVHFAQLHHIL